MHIHRYVFMYMCTYVGNYIILQGSMNDTYFPGQPDIELMSGGVPLWPINGSAVTLNQLSMNVIPGHSRNGSNIVISGPPTNNTVYICQLQLSADDNIFSYPAFVYVAIELFVDSCTCVHIIYAKCKININLT